MKHIRWQVLIALVGIAFLSVVLGLLALGTNLEERPDYGGTYTEGIAGRPNAISPIFSQFNDVDRDLVSLIFTGLTSADENGTLKPDLASQWVVSPDGLIITFTLRTDVSWQDGARFSADDVLFTIHAIQDPAYKGPPDLAAFWRTVAVTQVDATTVRFQLTQAYAPFLNYTTIGILPAHLLKDVPPGELFQNSFNRHPVGTGPFQLTELTANHVLLDANPHFYATRPYLSRIEFKFYPDNESIFAAYQREEVEGISRLLPVELPKAQKLDHLTLYNARLAGYTLVFLNLSKVPFQDKQVRQALLYAIDRQHLINDVLQGQGLPAVSPIEPGTWAYDNALNPYPFDVDKAKTLLDAAGWKDTNGDGIREKDQQTLAFTLTTNDDPTRVAIANEIAKGWQAIGVKAAVQSVPASLLVQNVLRPRQFDAVLYEWRTLSNDPDQYENWHQTQIPSGSGLGQNYSGLNDRDISEALEAARKTNDRAKRAELYQKFQELFVDRVPALLLFYPVYTYGIDSRVRGVQLAPMLAPSDRFRNIAQWYVKTKRVPPGSPVEQPTRPPIVEPTMAPLATAIPTAAPTVAAPSPGAPPPTSPPQALQCANQSAIIASPLSDSSVSGLIEIRGTASRPNLAYWKLEYRPDAASAYIQLYRSDAPVVDGVLSLWSTKTVANGVYGLQLTAVDTTGNFGSPCQIRVNVAN
ncbi:MAG: peptide ABC transporter substrate-binding protein [Chloroflexota bacterium]|nr:peptide ABC transporter substrate-binding protein [Chloroflexota bacterium]